MAKVPPFDMPMAERRRLLAPLRVDMSVAVVRAKNPFNVGAIIRVAHSYLVREVFLVGTEPYYERASMGMQRYENIVDCEDEATFPSDVVLLFGSENDGVPPRLLEASSQVIAIPMYGVNHSFPVSVAAGMVLCEWARRRDPRGGQDVPCTYIGPNRRLA